MKPLMLIIGICFVMSSCESGEKDQDGNSFKTIKIGDQVWMAENLNVTHYRDGTKIWEETNLKVWFELDSGAYIRDGQDKYYGKLYNFRAVTNPRGLAPKGWHIPSDSEWEELIKTLGGPETGSKMKSKDGWNKNGNGTNESGFSALPGGYSGLRPLNHTQVAVDRLTRQEHGDAGDWWSSSPSDAYGLVVWTYVLTANGPEILKKQTDYGEGLSVRCVKDKESKYYLLYFNNHKLLLQRG